MWGVRVEKNGRQAERKGLRGGRVDGLLTRRTPFPTYLFTVGCSEGDEACNGRAKSDDIPFSSRLARNLQEGGKAL